ncbi:MAG: 4Fe-4S binding protein [Vicinamibacterales bacterium]
MAVRQSRNGGAPATFHRAAQEAKPAPLSGPKRRFERRRGDPTQLARRSIQAAFVLLNLWIGARFYFFVRYFESGGEAAWVPRPPGVEGWLPIAALMNLKYFVLTGTVSDVHPAGMFLLLAFVSISLVYRKAFCSWLCPIGTISEWLWQGGREVFGKNLTVAGWADIPLRGLKYLLLGFFLYAIAGMGAEELAAFARSPYGLIADVKMLNFFRALSTTGATVILVLVVLSVLVQNFWCRYLCPYGALLGLVALASPSRITRDPERCIDCAKCAKACPSRLPVDKLGQVKSAECTGCMECVTACPVVGALDLTVPGRRRVPGWAVAAGLVVLLIGFVGYARMIGRWHSNIPDATYQELVPAANSFGHPGS